MINVLYMLLGLLLIGVAALQNFILLVIVFAGVFTFRYGALPIVILAIFIDGYFGAYGQVPLFSITAVIWYFCSELLLLRMRIMK